MTTLFLVVARLLESLFRTRCIRLFSTLERFWPMPPGFENGRETESPRLEQRHANNCAIGTNRIVMFMIARKKYQISLSSDIIFSPYLAMLSFEVVIHFRRYCCQ